MRKHPLKITFHFTPLQDTLETVRMAHDRMYIQNYTLGKMFLKHTYNCLDNRHTKTFSNRENVQCLCFSYCIQHQIDSCTQDKQMVQQGFCLLAFQNIRVPKSIFYHSSYTSEPKNLSTNARMKVCHSIYLFFVVLPELHCNLYA